MASATVSGNDTWHSKSLGTRKKTQREWALRCRVAYDENVNASESLGGDAHGVLHGRLVAHIDLHGVSA